MPISDYFGVVSNDGDAPDSQGQKRGEELVEDREDKENTILGVQIVGVFYSTKYVVDNPNTVATCVDT